MSVDAPGLEVRESAQPGDKLPPHASLLTDLACAFRLIAEHRHELAGVEIEVNAMPHGVRIHIPAWGGTGSARYAAVKRLGQLLRLPQPTIRIGNHADEFSTGFERWTVYTEVTTTGSAAP